jgi:hypothetical protein
MISDQERDEGFFRKRGKKKIFTKRKKKRGAFKKVNKN